jgi:hypothetical protein
MTAPVESRWGDELAAARAGFPLVGERRLPRRLRRRLIAGYRRCLGLSPVVLPTPDPLTDRVLTAADRWHDTRDGTVGYLPDRYGEACRELYEAVAAWKAGRP